MSQNFEIVKEVDENGNVFKATMVVKDEKPKNTKKTQKSQDSVKDSSED